ncbi:MAG: hypothetical protein OXI13_14060 [Gammaproteobacteria bacterium]|nr:hypothetical protein [Gammaproteobacteria bacterium]
MKIVPALFFMVLTVPLAQAQTDMSEYCEEITDSRSEVLGCLKLMQEELVRDVRTKGVLFDGTNLSAREIDLINSWCNDNVSEFNEYSIGKVRPNSSSACVKAILNFLENGSTLSFE